MKQSLYIKVKAGLTSEQKRQKAGEARNTRSRGDKMTVEVWIMQVEIDGLLSKVNTKRADAQSLLVTAAELEALATL